MHSAPKGHHVAAQICVVLLTMLTVVACASLGLNTTGTKENLGEAVDGFNTAIRWGEYKEGSIWISPPLRDYYWTLADQLKRDVHVTEFEIRQVSMRTADQTADVVLTYRYYSADDPQLQTKMVHQQWRFMEQYKIWQLVKHDLQSLVP